MKKIPYAIFILAIALALPFAKASAESTTLKVSDKAALSTDKGDAKTDQSTDASTDLSLKNQPLSVRKQKAEADLKALTAQLGVFYTRTQTAIDRLADKDVDTSKSQDELDIANTFLTEAKANLSLFSKILLPELKPERATADLRVSAKKTEDSLRAAREHLMNALASLKVALNTSIKDDAANNQ